MDATKKLVALVVTAVGIGAVSVALTAVGPHPVGAADVKDVVVANTTANPVPTAAQGVTQVAGTVTVGNLPSITITGGSVVGIDAEHNTVKIAPAGETPGRFSCSATLHPGVATAPCTLSVPPGQQFIIDSLSARVVSQTTNMDFVCTLTPAAGGSQLIYLPLTLQGQDSNSPTDYIFVAAAPTMHVIVDAGTTLTCQSAVTDIFATQQTELAASGFGHFLPVP